MGAKPRGPAGCRESLKSCKQGTNCPRVALLKLVKGAKILAPGVEEEPKRGGVHVRWGYPCPGLQPCHVGSRSWHREACLGLQLPLQCQRNTCSIRGGQPCKPVSPDVQLCKSRETCRKILGKTKKQPIFSTAQSSLDVQATGVGL